MPMKAIILLIATMVLLVKGFDRDYDKHGCCLSCGEFYCISSKKCETEWEKCELGKYDPKECTFTYTATLDGSTFHYDLAPWDMPTDNYFTINDEETHAGQQYSYMFRLCDKVDDKLLPDVCHKTTGTGKETCHGKAYAFQYYKTDWDFEDCYRISDCFPDELDPVEIGLIDPVKPATGIYIKYSGGNSCPQSYAMHSTCDARENDDANTYCLRSFTLNVYCHNEIKEIIAPENVIEAAGCSYIADINHMMGCPVECPRDSERRPCSARGLCYYAAYDGGDTVDEAESGDDDIAVPLQCVCEKGYYGDACELTEMSFGLSYYSRSSGASTWVMRGLIFTILFLSVILISVNLERIKILFSGVTYLAQSYWDEYWNKGRSGRDGLGNYSKVSTAAADDQGRIASELATKQQGDKYFGVLKSGAGSGAK